MLAILTVAARPQYLRGTLESLAAADLAGELSPVTLLVGSSDAAYVSNLPCDRWYDVRPMGERVSARIAAWSVQRRLNANFLRALRGFAARAGDRSQEAEVRRQEAGDRNQETGVRSEETGDRSRKAACGCAARADESVRGADPTRGAPAGLCLCEDDLEFSPDFVPALRRTVEEIERHIQVRRQEPGGRRQEAERSEEDIELRAGRYILSLYSPHDLERLEIARGEHYCAYAEPFYGTQCMYYPRAIAAELAAYVSKFGVEQYTLPADLLIGRFAAGRDLLFAARRSLVQHVGSISTGCGDGKHRSPTFGRTGVLAPPPRWLLGGRKPTRLRREIREDKIEDRRWNSRVRRSETGCSG